MSDVVGWYGFKSGKPVERESTKGSPLCWKCRDGRTRAHHRLCRKRGGQASALDQMRDAEAVYRATAARQVEEDNQAWNHVLDIR